MMRRRGAVKWVITPALLLIGGAIVNVAVAWGLSLRSWPYPEQYAFAEAHEPDREFMEWWLRYAPSDFPAPAKMHTLERSGYKSRAAYDKDVPNESHFFAYGRAHGWPVVCLEQQNWVKRAISDQYRALHLTIWPWSSQPPRELPIVPLWPGFVINTLFYALLLWLLIAATFAARRTLRRRRGQCEKCAYTIGVSPVCTECGAKFPHPLGEGRGEGVNKLSARSEAPSPLTPLPEGDGIHNT